MAFSLINVLVDDETMPNQEKTVRILHRILNYLHSYHGGTQAASDIAFLLRKVMPYDRPELRTDWLSQ